MYIIYHIHIIYHILLCRYGKYIFLYINNYIIPDYIIYITYNPCIHIYMQTCTNSIFFMFSCLYTHTHIYFFLLTFLSVLTSYRTTGENLSKIFSRLYLNRKMQSI